MKKLFLFLTLLIAGITANAQYSPSNNLNYIKLLKVPPVGAVEDSVLVYDGSDSFVKMRPSSVLIGKATATKTGTVKTDVTEADPIVYTKNTTDELLDLKTTLSAGAFSGFEVTNNGDGTISVGSGIAYLRSTNDQYAPLIKYPIAAYNNIPLVDNTNNYILVSYNGGSPSLVLNTTGSGIDTQTNSIAVAAARVGTTVHYVNLTGSNSDPNAKLRNRYLLGEGIRRISGLTISATNLKIATTSGITYSGLIRLDVAAIDTNAGGTYTLAYNNGSNWTRVTGQTDINNTQYNNAGTLTTLSNNHFRTDYVYTLVNYPSKLYVIMGTAEYGNLASAQAAPQPSSLPVELQQLGVLVGRVIVEKSATTLNVASPFTTTFTGATAQNHNDLAGLQGGAAGDYNHLTTAQVALVDGSEQTTNKSSSYTASSTTTYPNTKALVDGINKNDISKYGVLPTNSAAVNSANILNVPDLVDMIFLEGVYEFSEPISYRGNNIIGVSDKTVLKFSSSAGIVLDTDYSSSFLNYVVNKEFRDFKIESRDECINFCKYPTIIESFAYSKFINLTLKSDLSNAFKSDLVVSGDDFIGYANSFKNIVVETPTGAVFENMCLAVSTSIDNLHDLNSQILFKNCKLDLECTNLNFGFGFNLKHIIFNELSESNYHKVTFDNCNFEQMVSNPVVNLNANSILNIYFKNSYIQFGTDSNSLVGKQFYAFNPSYTNKTVDAIVSDTYATSKQFYPFIGLMTFVDFKDCTYRLNTTTVNESFIGLNIAHIIASSSSKIRSVFQDDYLHQNLYSSNELITYSSYKKTENVRQITPDVFINIDENEENISRDYVLANNFIEKSLNVTSYSGEYLVSSLIIFNLPAEQEILFDRINKGVNSNSTLINKGIFNVNIYVDGVGDPVLLPNHTYIYNQVTKSVLDITEIYSPLASPSFTGTPTAPTATAGTNTTQIATTAFVNNALTGTYLDLTTNQTAAGNKTFSGLTTLGNASNYVQVDMGNNRVRKVNSSGNVSWELTDIGAAQGAFRIGTPSAYIEGRESGSQYLKSSITFEAPSFIATAGTVRLKSYTVATLPAGTQGDTAYVTDATAPTYLGTLTGGGSVVCPVFYNGTAWVSH